MQSPARARYWPRSTCVGCASARAAKPQQATATTRILMLRSIACTLARAHVALTSKSLPLKRRSFDHPVGAAQHRVGNSDAERLGSALIDDQLGLGRPFDRDEIGRASCRER